MAETFAERLRRIRLEQGFSVPDLASAVGVSDGAIRQLESGQTKQPSFALGLRIADKLHVEPYYLALGAGFSMRDHLERIEVRLDAMDRRLAEQDRRRR
jgi:transcriptional regulator with XRE-family HTH domain